VIAEYERARGEAVKLEDIQRAQEKMDEWLNHPVRMFQHYVEQNTTHAFKIDPEFTMDRFLKGQTGSEERTYLTVNYGSRSWRYKVGYDEYRTDNSGKAGKLTLRASSVKGDDDSYGESKFDHKAKYSKKHGEIVRYMEEDIEAMKSRLDEKIKEEEKEIIQLAKIDAQWKKEGRTIEDASAERFQIIMDKKKSKSSYDTTAKMVEIKLAEGKKELYHIDTVEAIFTKAQVEAILAIVEKAQVTTY
jgi:hypothetical protein